MCGLPGSGKSTVSRELARRLGALRWDKDELRQLLFPPEAVAHGRALNDFCMELLYAAARFVFAKDSPPGGIIILDGRPFTRRAQRERLREAARQAGAGAAFIACTAPLEVLRRRIAGPHLAPDRNAALLERLAAECDPFDDADITLDTSALSAKEAVSVCMSGLLAARGIARAGQAAGGAS
jgi:predicted kinase